MKLRRELIERIAGRIIATLREPGLAEGMEVGELKHRVTKAITDDLMMEDRLNEEVREILGQHTQEMDRTNVEYHEMFKKIKAKLVRDRNLIL